MWTGASLVVMIICLDSWFTQNCQLDSIKAHLRRAYSALSGDAPLTAIATSSEGVIGMAQVKKDGYAICQQKDVGVVSRECLACLSRQSPPNPTKWGPMRSLHVSSMNFFLPVAPGPESCGEVKQSAQGCGFANHLLVCYAVKKTWGNTTVDACPMTAQICWSWRHLGD